MFVCKLLIILLTLTMTMTMSAEAVLERFSSVQMNFHLKKSDFVRRVCEKNISTADLSFARSSIFRAAQSMGLVDERADIVSRRGTSLNPLHKKLAGDVWDLAQCISSRTRVKREMIKNGKRGLSYIESQLESKVSQGAGTNKTMNYNHVMDNAQCNISMSISETMPPSPHERPASCHNTSAQTPPIVSTMYINCQPSPTKNMTETDDTTMRSRATGHNAPLCMSVQSNLSVSPSLTASSPVTSRCAQDISKLANDTHMLATREIETINRTSGMSATGVVATLTAPATSRIYPDAVPNPPTPAISRCASNSILSDDAANIRIQKGNTTSPSRGAKNLRSPQSHGNEPNHNLETSNIFLQVQQLQKSVYDIKSKMRRLEGLMTKPVCHCHIHVVTRKSPYSANEVKSSLESLLTCPVIGTHLVRAGSSSAYKVKIYKDHLHRALSSCHTTSTGHRVRLWKSCNHQSPSKLTSNGGRATNSSQSNVSILLWNCRGFNCSEAYLKHLSRHGDIILLQEHWLWPFNYRSSHQLWMASLLSV